MRTRNIHARPKCNFSLKSRDLIGSFHSANQKISESLERLKLNYLNFFVVLHVAIQFLHALLKQF